MGFYETHIMAVACRVGERLRQGNSEELINKYLTYCGWTKPETEQIMTIAKRYKDGLPINGKGE